MTALLLAAALAASYNAHVVRVVDGDTVVVEKIAEDDVHAVEDRRVRLVGVAAPEVRHRSAECVSVTPCGCEAADELREILPVGVVVFVQVTGRDRFGRDLALVWRSREVQEPGRILVNLAMVSSGLAKVEYRWPFEWRNEFGAAERRAFAKRIGVWSRHGDACVPTLAPPEKVGGWR